MTRWSNVEDLGSDLKLLWFAVLRRAVFDYVLFRGRRAKRHEWSDAERYIFHNERHAHGLTFEEVCCLFGWCPDYVRRLIYKMDRDEIRNDDLSWFLSSAPKSGNVLVLSFESRSVVSFLNEQSEAVVLPFTMRDDLEDCLAASG